MCIVIDTNSLAHVFNQNSMQHQHFQPVCNWILEGEGHIVYGGTKYKKELSKAHRYLRLVRRLKDARRAFEIDQGMVDAERDRIEEKTKGTKCNDQHIIAIFVVSGCRLFCSLDNKADKYIRDKSLYPKGFARPSIYRSCNHKHLLSSRYIVSLKNVV